MWNNFTPDQTLIRAVNILKFRDAISAEFRRRGIAQPGQYSTDAVVDKPIKAIHVQEVRDTIGTVKAVQYTDNPIEANITVVKAEHFDQLGAVLNLLEAAPKEGGTSTCNAGCTGLCVSCAGSCVNGCSGCTSCSGCNGCAGCGDSCSNSCTDGCRGCTTICSINCVNGCSVYCTSACGQSCGSACYGNSCTTYCTSGCGQFCHGQCSDNCVSTSFGY